MSVFIDNENLRTRWYPVAEIIDVDPGPVGVKLLGEPMVLWRSSDGSIVAAPDRCPHREAPLSIGSVGNGDIVCAYHGWTFGCAGACTGIPSSGIDATIPPTARLAPFEVRETYGLIWVCPGTPVGEPPVIAQESDPAFRRINTGVELWKCSATRMVDNFMDVSHFPWVHVGTFGAGQALEVPKIELSQLDADFFGYAYEVDVNNPEEAHSMSGSDADVLHRHMSTGFHLPFDVRSTILYEDGLEHILLLCSTPVDDETALFTFVIWRNDDHSLDPEETISFDRAIGAEDKRMLEQVPGVLPLGRTDLISVQSDKPSVEWRRQFAELLGATE